MKTVKVLAGPHGDIASKQSWKAQQELWELTQVQFQIAEVQPFFYIKYKMKVKGFLIFINILQKDNTLYLFEISKLIEFY